MTAILDELLEMSRRMEQRLQRIEGLLATEISDETLPPGDSEMMTDHERVLLMSQPDPLAAIRAREKSLRGKRNRTTRRTA